MKTITAASATESAAATDSLEPLIDTALCLSAIADLVIDDDIPIGALVFRIRQYSECAAGVYCPEVAFDPVAISLRTLAARQKGTPAGAEWTARVRQTLAELFSQRRGIKWAPAEQAESDWRQAA